MAKKRKHLAVLSGLTAHLTGERPVDALAQETLPGQAHWAGTGPRGKTCRECVLWVADHGADDHSTTVESGRGAAPNFKSSP